MSHYKERTEDGHTCQEIFQMIDSRQIAALMFHTQMADLFDFLGLMGFKRMHEYQYFSENMGNRRLKRYYLNHHNKVLMSGHVDAQNAIPEGWVKYTRFDVTAQVRKQAVEKAFEEYETWELETKQLYEKCALDLLHMGRVDDFNEVNCYVKDVSHELKCVDRMLINLRGIGFDPVELFDMQADLHEKYRRKTRKLKFSK